MRGYIFQQPVVILRTSKDMKIETTIAAIFVGSQIKILIYGVTKCMAVIFFKNK
jgi:hypothetical protein